MGDRIVWYDYVDEVEKEEDDDDEVEEEDEDDEDGGRDPGDADGRDDEGDDWEDCSDLNLMFGETIVYGSFDWSPQRHFHPIPSTKPSQINNICARRNCLNWIAMTTKVKDVLWVLDFGTVVDGHLAT